MKLVKAVFYKDFFSIISILSLILFTYICVIFFFDNYNLIAFSDHDEGYLLEQLILKLDRFNIDRVHSIEAEYGVEFYYLKYLFNILINIFNLDKIHIYYILISVHAVLASVSFVIIFKIFKLLNINKFFNFVFLTTILAIPEIFIYSVNLKPDLNIEFFFLSCSLYYFIKFNIFNFNRDYYLLVFFTAIALTIKLWSLPFIIIFLFINFQYKNDLKKYKFIFLLLCFLFFIFINNYLLNLNYFFITDSEFLDFIVSNIFFSSFVTNFTNFFYLILISVNLIIIIPILIIIFNKKNLHFLFSFYLFIILWFIIISPFLFDFTIFFKTLYAHSVTTSLNLSAVTVNSESFFSYFIKDLTNFKINSLIFALFLISPIIIYKFKSKLNFNKNIINFFLTLSIFFIIFEYSLTIYYYNQLPVKYLYFIYISIFIFYLIDKIIIFNKLFLPLTYLIIFINLINFVNNFHQYKKTLNYFTFENLHHEMLDLHNKKYFSKISNLYICGSYPANIKKNKFNFYLIRHDKCVNTSFVSKLNNDDLIVINSASTTKDFYKIYSIVGQEQVFLIGRFGKIVSTNLIFFKKI
jgi:hypothetical protein